MPLLELENVTKVYGKTDVVLQDINLGIGKGEFLSLVGVSGAGKSTLLKMMYADEHPTNGHVYFGGKDVSAIKRHLLPFYRRNFGTVFQDAKLLPYKTIFENVAYALEVQGRPDEQIREEVPKILDIVGLGTQMKKYPSQISGGEAQRASVARALIHRPRVLIADEPTGNLDPASTDAIINLLLQINAFGTTVILATHDKSTVDRIKRRVITVDQGRIIADDAQGNYVIR